jgi:hypothetical protein
MSNEDAAGTKTGTYEEALASRIVRDGYTDGEPMPDRPTGAAVHVNPALTPAPHYAPKADRIPVPVINDPGVLAHAPTLQELNAAAAGSYGVTVEDPTSGITEDSNREEIRKAAEARKQSIEEGTQKVVDEANAGATGKTAPAHEPVSESKFG